MAGMTSPASSSLTVTVRAWKPAPTTDCSAMNCTLSVAVPVTTL